MVTRVAIMKLAHKTSGKRLSLSRAGSRVGKRLCSQSFRSLEEQGATHGLLSPSFKCCALQRRRRREGSVLSAPGLHLCYIKICLCVSLKICAMS